jgi:hypothetical protein
MSDDGTRPRRLGRENIRRGHAGDWRIPQAIPFGKWSRIVWDGPLDLFTPEDRYGLEYVQDAASGPGGIDHMLGRLYEESQALLELPELGDRNPNRALVLGFSTPYVRRHLVSLAAARDEYLMMPDQLARFADLEPVGLEAIRVAVGLGAGENLTLG